MTHTTEQWREELDRRDDEADELTAEREKLAAAVDAAKADAEEAGAFVYRYIVILLLFLFLFCFMCVSFVLPREAYCHRGCCESRCGGGRLVLRVRVCISILFLASMCLRIDIFSVLCECLCFDLFLASMCSHIDVIPCDMQTLATLYRSVQL
jgi:hypothetical protein